MEGNEIKRITRLVALLTQLQTKRLLTAPELAHKFSVSVRTIYRDIKVLEQAGIPVMTEEGKGFRLMESYRLPPLMFTEEEANALLTAEQLIIQNSDVSLTRNYRLAVDKVKAVLRWSSKDKANLLSRRTRSYALKGNLPKTDWLAVLQAALTHFKAVRIEYHSPITEKTSTRVMEPFALLLSGQGTWLLAAWCRLRRAYRTIRVDGIVQLVMLDESFEDHGLTLEEFFRLSEKKQPPLT